MQGRDLDLVVWGATGFTGGLIAERIAAHAAGSPTFRWAIGGRDEAKLAAVARSLESRAPGGAPHATLLGDATSLEDMRRVAARARVVVSTVGPFARWGLPLVKACAELGTSYCDTTGEVPFIRASIDACEKIAKASGARIVHAAGFDSLPSDLGVLILAERALSVGRTLGATELVVTAARGGASGGTIGTMLGTLDQAREDRALRRLLGDPYALSPDRASDLDVDGRDALGVGWDARLGRFTVPFFMGPINTRVVRRSNALFGFRYGRRFAYSERMVVGRAGRGLPGALVATLGMGAFIAAASFGPTRGLLDARLPKPGQGPSEEERTRGFFKMSIFGTLDGDAQPSLVAEVEGINDPGYGETAKMTSETALALLDPSAVRPGFEAGVLTPATALGLPLVERLRAKGMTFRVEPFVR